ncbi:predicted protein [Chaetomium globosum CBS 148.51]|uniref:Uncharacterized protein n=1 Tax=Chaetomium globosum (strain ATCC 6205 / CBS 148.51 / DSM 1962 / NBRC 6347 / NRRL 1970) TaxID=306901 RepID=Q2GZZ8_CHAGB|nr:uncharacterized protein CHGG_04898 [Chaetomium globosum CBS 148.51]EAQ88279.1 predicted protein [Chaetomium globosum CBS 148.51]
MNWMKWDAARACGLPGTIPPSESPLVVSKGAAAGQALTKKMRYCNLSISGNGMQEQPHLHRAKN